MSFFQSDVVRAEMVEISELQEEVYSNVMKFHYMNDEDKCYHINLLDKLIDKQKILYARLSLSDDPEAKSVVDNMRQGIVLLGADPNLTIEKMFDDLANKIKNFKSMLPDE